MMESRPNEPLDLHTLLTSHNADSDTALPMRHTAEVASRRNAAHQELLVSSTAVPEGALFTGVYRIGEERTLSQAEWEAQPGSAELSAAGAHGPDQAHGDLDGVTRVGDSWASSTAAGGTGAPSTAPPRPGTPTTGSGRSSATGSGDRHTYLTGVCWRRGGRSSEHGSTRP